MRKRIKWADGKLVKTELDAQLLTLLGPKVEQDNVKEKKVNTMFIFVVEIIKSKCFINMY